VTTIFLNSGTVQMTNFTWYEQNLKFTLANIHVSGDDNFLDEKTIE